MSDRIAPRLLSLKIPGPAGDLEGILRCPTPPPPAAALICHPHPQFGGTMHSPVVYRAARAFHRRGFATLRFNYRGVGLSDGKFDGHGGEQEDVLAALRRLQSEAGDISVTLLGYSYGSWVGSSACGRAPGVGRVIGIGLPTALYSFDFLETLGKPFLCIQGSEDQTGPPATLKALANLVGPGFRQIIIPGADHLFTGQLNRLEETLYWELEPSPST